MLDDTSVAAGTPCRMLRQPGAAALRLQPLILLKQSEIGMRTRMAVLTLAALCGACVQPARQPASAGGDPPLDGSWTGREERSVSAFREWHLRIAPENIQTLRVDRVVPGRGYYVNENAYRCEISFIASLDPAALRGTAHARISLAIAGTTGDCATRRFTFYGVALDPRTITGELREEAGEFAELALRKE
jgi:hypothetical protein